MLPLDFWVIRVSFSFCGHDRDTYRTVVYGHGAFELCLPSLGFFLTKLTLRCRFVGQRHRMIKVRTLAGMSGLEQYEVSTLQVSVADVLGIAQEA